MNSGRERLQGGARARRLAVWRALALALSLFATSARADPPPPRDVTFEWDPDTRLLYLNLGFRDVMTPELQAKLSRGLPTTIVLTAAIYQSGSNQPLSTTAQTCKVTWHVWEEAYRIEITRPGGSQVRWTTTVEGVLRRCAEARRLLAGEGAQIPAATELVCNGKVQVNPVSAELLQKIKRWVMRPSGTGTAAPSDALFSTFTGLFLQRVGDAERELKFNSRPARPRVVKIAAENK